MENLVRDNSRNLHLQIEPNTFAFVESYNRSLSTGYKFSIEKFDDQLLVYKLMADKIKLDTVSGEWTLLDYFIRTLDTAGNQHLVKGKELDTTLTLKPTDLYKVKEVFEEMNLYELNDFIASEKAKGSIGYKSFEIEKHKRLAGPAAIIILTLIGVALSSRKVRGGIGMHLGAGIALTFSYILLMQISTVFSTFGNLSPAIASWIPNIIFLFIGLYLLYKAPK